jgi:hypothetical protein
VNVNANASSPQVFSATVSGGGDFNPANNTANDSVPIGQTSQTTLTGNVPAASKSGPGNARDWLVNVVNNDTNPAVNAQITGMTLTQTSGTTCSIAPSITTVFPVNVGTIAASGTAPGHVVTNFSGCAASARFRVVLTFSANGGANGGMVTINNQLQ